MSKRPKTFAYVAFYALLWPDTWQIFAGLLTAWIVTPRLTPSAGYDLPATVISYAMLAAIGYAASGLVIRPIFRRLHARMLGRKDS